MAIRKLHWSHNRFTRGFTTAAVHCRSPSGLKRVPITRRIAAGSASCSNRIQGNDDIGAIRCALHGSANMVYAGLAGFLPGDSQSVFADGNTAHPARPGPRQINYRRRSKS